MVHCDIYVPNALVSLYSFGVLYYKYGILSFLPMARQVIPVRDDSNQHPAFHYPTSLTEHLLGKTMGQISGPTLANRHGP